MKLASGTTDRYLYFVAVDSTDFTTRETGLSSFTVYRSRNGAAAAAMTTPTINETDATNMPGVYELLLDEDTTIDAGDDTQEMVLHITQASMAPVTRVVELYRPKITEGTTVGVTGTTVNATATAIATDAVSNDAIADDAIDSGKIAAGAFTAAKFAASSLDGKGDWATTSGATAAQLVAALSGTAITISGLTDDNGNVSSRRYDDYDGNTTKLTFTNTGGTWMNGDLTGATITLNVRDETDNTVSTIGSGAVDTATGTQVVSITLTSAETGALDEEGRFYKYHCRATLSGSQETIAFGNWTSLDSLFSS